MKRLAKHLLDLEHIRTGQQIIQAPYEEKMKNERISIIQDEDLSVRPSILTKLQQDQM